MVNIVRSLAGGPARHFARVPDVVDELVSPLLSSVNSAHTARICRTALRYWSAWFSLRYDACLRLPVTVSAVLQFIDDHAQMLERGADSPLPVALDHALVRGGFKSATCRRV